MTHKIQVDDTVREASTEESARIDAVHAEAESETSFASATIAAAASARAKLASLGLTPAEIKALVG